ncbi:unnamed protein product [Urochloa humidicola]
MHCPRRLATHLTANFPQAIGLLQQSMPRRRALLRREQALSASPHHSGQQRAPWRGYGVRCCPRSGRCGCSSTSPSWRAAPWAASSRSRGSSRRCPTPRGPPARARRSGAWASTQRRRGLRLPLRAREQGQGRPGGQARAGGAPLQAQAPRRLRRRRRRQAVRARRAPRHGAARHRGGARGLRRRVVPKEPTTAEGARGEGRPGGALPHGRERARAADQRG